MYNLVLGIVIKDETVVEQVTRVAFFTIRVEDFNSRRNIFQTFNDKALFLIKIVPNSLLRQFMIEHVCERC
jgi:hypothetical protein